MKFLSFISAALPSWALYWVSSYETAFNETTASLQGHQGPSASRRRNQTQLNKTVPVTSNWHTDFHHRLTLDLDVSKTECENSVLDFAEYAITAALLPIPGFPSDLAPLVARSTLPSDAAQDLANTVEVFLEIENPTPADFATAFTQLVDLLTREGVLTPSRIIAAPAIQGSTLTISEKSALLAELESVFTDSGFSGTIDPTLLVAEGLITQAQAAVDVLLANCVSVLTPTSSPSSAPSNSPTISFPPTMSMAPSPAPTTARTPAPTTAPTPSPTIAPSPKPVTAPTPASPVMDPPLAPVMDPTPTPVTPELPPTLAPAFVPTPAPAPLPTYEKSKRFIIDVFNIIFDFLVWLFGALFDFFVVNSSDAEDDADMLGYRLLNEWVR